VPFIPETDSSSNSRAGLYGKKDFRYDAENDCYWCPAGKALPYSYQTTSNGQEVRVYIAKGCTKCALKHQCHRNKYSRRIKRWVHEEVLEEMAQRVRAEPDKIKERKSLVEHPFGTIKRSMDQGYFLTRRLWGVRTETSLTMLAYNIKRALALKGTQGLLAALSM